MKKIIVFALLITNALLTQAQVSDKDKKFVKCAAEGGLYEVKISELAKMNGFAIEVKTLAKQMVDDHFKANSELKDLADKKGVSFPTTMSKKEMKYHDKLSKKHGKDFDKAYTKCLKMHHKRAICLFKKEAKKGSDADIKGWAASTLPTLEHHQEMIKETCKAIKDKK